MRKSLCACVRMCERERERASEQERERQKVVVVSEDQKVLILTNKNSFEWFVWGSFDGISGSSVGHKGRWIRSASLLMEDGAFWMAHMGLFWEIMHF